MSLIHSVLWSKPYAGARAGTRPQKVKRWRAMCAHKGCHSRDRVAEYTYMGIGEADEQAHFCWRHASVDGGFCPGCSCFVLGIDGDEESLYRYGLCDQCMDEVRADMGEFDEEDWDEEGWDY